MKIKVKSIQFDYLTEDDEELLSEEELQQLTDKVFNTEWIVDEEYELTDLISDTVGWCIQTIDYEIVD